MMGGGMMDPMGGGGGYHEENEYRTGGGMGMGGFQNDGKSCVLLPVYGLEPPNWNCACIFNLLCQYGNVNKVFFMKNKPNTAMVEMGCHEGLDNVVRNLQDITVFGEKLKFHMSKKHIRINNPLPEFVLTDSSPSVKEYFSECNQLCIISEKIFCCIFFFAFFYFYYFFFEFTYSFIVTF